MGYTSRRSSVAATRHLALLAFLALVLAASCGAEADGDAGSGAEVGAPAGPAAVPIEPTAEVATATAVQSQAAGSDLVVPGASTPPSGDGGGLTGVELEMFLVARYELYWEAFDAARVSPTEDPKRDAPRLADLAAGEQLAVSYDAVTALAEQDQALREPPTPAVDGVDVDTEHRVRVDAVESTVATLSGCIVNDDVRYSTATGSVLSDEVTTVLSTATLALNEGEWKVIRSRALEIDEGVGGCWLTPDADFPH